MLYFLYQAGSNLKNLILRSRDYNFPINIKLVVTNNNPNAFGLNYAKKYSIPYLIVNVKLRDYENQILFALKKQNSTYLLSWVYENYFSYLY